MNKSLKYILIVILAASPVCLGLELHVTTEGDDSWSGRQPQQDATGKDGPLRTLEGARDQIRRLRKDGQLPEGGVTVHIHPGEYALDETLIFTAEDGGTADAPIVYRADADKDVSVIGGQRITNFKRLGETDAPRLDPKSRPHVWAADLKAVNVADYGDPVERGKRLELFFDHRPMTLARWPNEGFTTIGELVGDEPHTVHGRTGNKVGKFTYEGDRPERWVDEPDLRLHGFWFWDWADAHQKVESIDLEDRIISTVPPYHHYGYRAGQRYYVLNALSELDAPGEYYLDRDNGMLYFWPPAPIESAAAYISVLDTVISIKDASHVTIHGLTLSYNRGTTLTVQNGSHNRIEKCTIRNIGGSAVTVNGGDHHAVAECEMYFLGDSGISLEGGDRNTLTPGGHEAVKNHIHHYSRTSRTYRTAVTVAGVGCRVANNLIHDAPHMAIGLSGNEHVIEYNEVHTVCTETDDAGAFYMGRDWTWRGNIIRYNYFHHIGQYKSNVGTQAIYLDDWASGTTVFGNVCYKVYRAVLVGGGRNNVVENNMFIDCAIGVHVDSRGLGWAKYYFDSTNNTLVERLAKVPYRESPWKDRYPELLTLYDDEPALAKYNKVVRNIAVDTQKWLDLHNGLTDKIVLVEDNLVDTDPHFVNADGPDFRLKPDSPAFDKGFQPIPWDKIGLPMAGFRAMLPYDPSVR